MRPSTSVVGSTSSVPGNLSRLMVLLDYSEGVLARLYNIIHHQCHPKTARIPPHLRTYLLRKVLNPTDDIHAQNESDYFAKHQDSLQKENLFVFNVLGDIISFTDEATAAFKAITHTVIKFDVCIFHFYCLYTLHFKL